MEKKERIKKFVRFLDGETARYGLLQGENRIEEIEGEPSESVSFTERQYKIGEVRLLPPCQPTKIVAVGLNYRDHAHELNLPEPEEPILFLKPSSALIGQDEAIVLPSMSKAVEYEAELGIIIGRQARRVEVSRASEYILGYTCINDVTARDLQKKDGQWTRAKSFDTFASVGPCLVTGLAPDNLFIRSYLNREIRQSSNTNRLIFSPLLLVSFISQVMTLWPGDIISTGTPAGVGPMHPGDIIEIEIEGIGILSNSVVSEETGHESKV